MFSTPEPKARLITFRETDETIIEAWFSCESRDALILVGLLPTNNPTRTMMRNRTTMIKKSVFARANDAPAILGSHAGPR